MKDLKRWCQSLGRSFRRHKRQDYYQLVPTVYRLYYQIWAFDFWNRRWTWEWPAKQPYMHVDGTIHMDYPNMVEPSERKIP